MDIAGGDLSPAAHGDGSGKALTAGGGAAVQHPDVRLGQLGADHAEPGRRILNIEHSFPEGIQLLQAAGAGQHQAIGHPAMGPDRHMGLLQPPGQVGNGDF